ncbi:MBL fold metallo-hydrolase [Mucilaginibacter jinjuensis]|uniref:3',5'-cyclic-nucleotide phosphodiesterase n=1 Tax=Mucilaginibacter jinjuensis TaxID=1176721 RepID=A0ABY7T641_9SPHI|nr:3',5'-cyclic-nucleotide phosphodiesterase [Mucilaginibacter jinjuensis]WCT11243.1 3',5'-cyclic-nucleotide phosphodiesterase [Mucilaginibacter jinjuensis]
MINIRYVITLFFCFAVMSANAQHNFKLVPLGVLGGADESNLSAYMLAPQGSDHYICLDAGTLRAGINKAVANKVFNVPAEHVLRQYIKGYFISHSHLDHVSGLILNSPDDSTKSIYGFADCLKTLETHYFTWTSWANFADAGEAPALKKYHYEVLTPGEEMPIKNTEMTVKAFPLSHSNLISTAFLVKSQNSYVLYLGDTGPDAIEKSTNMHKLWEAIAPLIKNKSLKAIMIETSFPDEQPDKSLFGHFTPKWLMSEFTELETLTGAGELKGFNVIITHLKLPQTNIVKIKQQLNAENKLQLHLIYPKQGEAISL